MIPAENEPVVDLDLAEATQQAEEVTARTRQEGEAAFRAAREHLRRAGIPEKVQRS